MNSKIKKFFNRGKSKNSFTASVSKKFSKNQRIRNQKRLDQKLVAYLNKNKLPKFKQIKHLAKVLSSKEKLAIKILALLILVSAVWLGYNNIFKQLTYLPKNGGEFTEGLVGSPLYLNPILAQTNDVDIDISSLIFSGLMKYNKNLELETDLAEGYEYNEEENSYTFQIKKNIEWHDGEPFSAGDVVFTFQSIQDENFKSPLYRTFQGVEIEKIDDYSVKFTLAEKYAAFLNVLTVGILPEHIWYDIPPVTANISKFNQKPVGTGPFKFKSIIKESSGIIKSYTFEKNKDYYGKVPYINKVIFKFYPDQQLALDALINKNIDSVGFITKESLEKIIGKGSLNIYNFNLSQYTSIFFNTDKNELLDNVKLRKALAYAIDKKQIIESVLNNQGQDIHTPILPGFLGHSDEVQKYDFNPTKSAEILIGLGWELDGDYLKKDDIELKITLTTVDQPENVKTAEIIKQSWNNIGINVELQIVPRTQIQKEKLITREYEALLYGEVIGYDPDPYPFWHSSQREHPGVNLTNYANRKADELLEEARKTSDDESRIEKYIEFQNIIAENIPAIFLYAPTYTYPLSKAVKGLDIQRISNSSDRFIDIENWYIKTKKSLQ